MPRKSSINPDAKSQVVCADPPAEPVTPLPPCRVCGDGASGLHYGANTCEACKVSNSRDLWSVA